ncbi:MAG: beta-N-acetylglucosaminidase domain-containing protein, partial [Acidimicrobiia bacterium]|nr:beta-N-acetylglucosaminidase domain-containing protein [Acidimicrobiia bacterium]
MTTRTGGTLLATCSGQVHRLSGSKVTTVLGSRRLRRAFAVVAAVTFGAVLVPVTATAGRAASAPPPFAFTGAIEGSYGPPWSHADRLSAINWMAANGLDIYIHAPKFDPYARANWRDPYPPAQRADFASEIALASRLGVAWVP